MPIQGSGGGISRARQWLARAGSDGSALIGHEGFATWGENPWVNGHTSVVLAPGQRKKYQIRFAFIDGYEATRDELYKAGNLGIRVVPSMVVQENTDVLVELKSQSPVEKIDFLSDNITVKNQTRVAEKTLLTLSFRGRGQKSAKLHYGEGRST